MCDEKVEVGCIGMDVIEAYNRENERVSDTPEFDGSVSDGLTPYEREFRKRFRKDGFAGITQAGSAKGIDRGNMTV